MTSGRRRGAKTQQTQHCLGIGCILRTMHESGKGRRWMGVGSAWPWRMQVWITARCTQYRQLGSRSERCAWSKVGARAAVEGGVEHCIRCGAARCRPKDRGCVPESGSLYKTCLVTRSVSTGTVGRHRNVAPRTGPMGRTLCGAEMRAAGADIILMQLAPGLLRPSGARTGARTGARPGARTGARTDCRRSYLN